MADTRSWWGWGVERQALSDAECAELAAMSPRLSAEPAPVPRVEDLELRAPRIAAPEPLAQLFDAGPVARAAHTHGKAYRDVVRNLRGDLAAAPDLVAFPNSEQDVIDILEWAGGVRAAVVPFGGGSSVVGGIECREGDYAAVVSLDLGRLDRVLEVDRASRAARIQGGVLGPALEDQLRAHGLTMRHYPQSFEFSSLGGWIATRAGGHYATLHTHIDDFVESLRVVTPTGVSESWRLPASGAGPSPDRMFIGSEGALGVIVEAWMRVQDRPVHRASQAVRFADFQTALTAVREIAQSGLNPSNCRLLDPGEAAFSGAAQGGESVLVLGFESATHPVGGRLAETVELALTHGGETSGAAAQSDTQKDSAERGDGAVENWRATFLRMPYMRDALARVGAIAETFETATTWDRLPAFYETVREQLSAAIAEICGEPGFVNCRLTHVYPDGAAPYFSVIAAAGRGRELEAWDEIKAAASEILVRERATITHHHAVGRDHAPYYARQRPERFAAALRGAKAALDPERIMNPGVLGL